MRAINPGWLVIAILKKLWQAAPQLQQFPRKIEFNTSVLPVRRELSPVCTERRQEPIAQLKIHGTAVIRVYQRQIPKLSSLIKIRHARQQHLQRELRE